MQNQDPSPYEEVTPEAVDAALREFWAGSAHRMDELIGRDEEGSIEIAKVLLEVTRQLGDHGRGGKRRN